MKSNISWFETFAKLPKYRKITKLCSAKVSYFKVNEPQHHQYHQAKCSLWYYPHIGHSILEATCCNNWFYRQINHIELWFSDQQNRQLYDLLSVYAFVQFLIIWYKVVFIHNHSIKERERERERDRDRDRERDREREGERESSNSTWLLSGSCTAGSRYWCGGGTW